MTTRWTAYGVLVPATKPLILVAGTNDDKDSLRFARVDENIKLHCRANAYTHVFANIVAQIIKKETSILNQVYELSSLKDSERSSQNMRRNRNVRDFFLGRSTGDKYIFIPPL